MLKIGYLIVTCFVLSGLFGQSPKKIDNDLVFNKEKYSKKNISLSPKVQKKLEFPFLEGLAVIDARSDSTCIGFRNRNSEKNNQVLQFTSGLKTEFENYLNRISKFKNDGGPYSVVLVVKSYWINEFEVDEDESDKVADNRGTKYSARKTALRATFDYYLKKDNEYFVAYRYDTMASAFLNIKDFSQSYLEDFLEVSIKRLQSINPEMHIQNKRIFTRAELENYYKQRWEKPILKDEEFERGVYKTFNEFLNNHPSITRFVVKKDKLADIIYVPQDKGELVPARDVWGYCDGKKFFIKSGENYYPLVRVQNGFYFLGSKELIRDQDDYYIPDPYTGTALSYKSDPYLRNRLFPMKVDMEKGITY